MKLRTIIGLVCLLLAYPCHAREALSLDQIVNIPAPEKTDPLYKKKAAIYYENIFVNSLIDVWSKSSHHTPVTIEIANNVTRNIREANKAVQHYRDALKAGADDKIAFEKYEKEWNTACIACIREDFGKHFVSAHVTAETSPQCKRILDSKAFLKRVDAIDFTDETGTAYKFWIDDLRTGRFPQHRCSVNGSEQTVYYPIWWPGEVGYSELDGKLYHTDSNHGATRFYVFEFVPEFFHFKEVCEIKADILSFDVTFGADNPVCNDVSKGRHKAYEVRSITDLMTEREYKAYHQEMCTASANNSFPYEEDKNKREELVNQKKEACIVSKDVENDYYDLASGTSGGSKALKADYNNDGKAEYLIDSSYSSGGGTGCEIDHFRVYDPTIKNTRHITTGRVNDYYSHGGNYDVNYQISCLSGSQQIISVRGKNYLLTLNTEGIEQLHEITTLEDGTNQTTEICKFNPVLQYR